METKLRHAIADSRLLSRTAGVARLKAEAKTVGLTLRHNGHHLAQEVALDMVRSQRSAKSYAARWLRKAVGETDAEAAQAASENTLGSLLRIGSTEASQSFSAGRNEQFRMMAHGGNALRRWDAFLDACPICRLANGTIARVNESFPLGEPGDVHPFCKCCWTFLTLNEVFYEAA